MKVITESDLLFWGNIRLVKFPFTYVPETKSRQVPAEQVEDLKSLIASGDDTPRQDRL